MKRHRKVQSIDVFIDKISYVFKYPGTKSRFEGSITLNCSMSDGEEKMTRTGGSGQ